MFNWVLGVLCVYAFLSSYDYLKGVYPRVFLYSCPMTCARVCVCEQVYVSCQCYVDI